MLNKVLLLFMFLSPFLKAEDINTSPTSSGNILSESWTALTSETGIPLIQNSAGVSNTDYAVSLWFKTTNGNCGLFSVTDNRGRANDRHLYLKGGNLRTRVWNNESISTSGLNLADDQWHQVTHTFGGVAGGQKLYIDGVLQAQGNKNYSHFNWHTKTLIGYSSSSITPIFSGELTGYRMYSHALTQEDVLQNINQEYPVLYPIGWQREILKVKLNQAKALYEQSSENIGIEEGQYSAALRYNYNFIIKATEAFLEANEIIRPYKVNSLTQATKTFEGGVKPTEKVSGKAFGRQPYWNSSWSAEKAFDGNIHSGYCLRSPDHGYVGLDLGEGNTKVVKKARFICRNRLGRRMTNNKFQGSLDGTNYVDLFTIEQEPKFEWTSAPITDETPYRFYRYYDVPGGAGYGNISELEFYTLPPQEFYMENHKAISLVANVASQVLPASHLKADHGGLLPQFITYKLLELPLHGTLSLKETQLNLDDTFTQEDLNKGYLNFSADDSRMSDSFKLEVTSAIGGLLPEVLVAISIDSDGDGLTDQQELVLGTNYDQIDSDSDGLSDFWEVENGLDPVADTLTPLVTAIQGEKGLSAAYHFGSFRSTNDFSKKAPSKVTKISQINFAFGWGRTQVANSGRAHYVGAQYSGYLYVPLAGSYTFTLSADDGARLFINGSQVVNNDGLHGTISRSGTISLIAGFHPIRCDYFEAGGAHSCILKWSGPSRPKETIPASFFFLSLPEHQALQESVDRDHDGLTDFLEAQEGTDPLNPDSDGDKLLDGEEFHAAYYGYKTNPLSVDTDEDTVTDWDEIFFFKSNPLIADFDGTFLSQIDIKPKDTSDRLGNWAEDGDEIHSETLRGHVEYTIDVKVPGFYMLSSVIAQHLEASSKNIMDIFLYVDGEYINRQKINVGKGPVTTNWLINNLAPGNHRIKLFWNNVYKGTRLQIKSLRLSRPGGPDNDENDRADWVDSYLKNTCSLEPYSIVSKVSPAQVEGKAIYLSKMSTSLNTPVQRGTQNRWFTDIPLQKEEPTDFTINFEQGLYQRTGQITWEVTNVLDEGEMTIRQGSTLLLNAIGVEEAGSVATLTINEETVVVSTDSPLQYTFDTPETYEIIANYQGTETLRKTLIVKVIAVPETDAPYIWRNKQRYWNWAGLPEEVTLQATGMQMTKRTQGGFYLTRNEVLENINIVARLGENGPIIKTLPTKAFWLRDVANRYVSITEDLGGDTLITKDNLFGFQLPEEVSIEIWTITGVVFIDGSRKKILTKSDFNELDIWLIELLKTPDKRGGSCHWYRVYQNGIFVGQQNKNQ